MSRKWFTALAASVLAASLGGGTALAAEPASAPASAFAPIPTCPVAGSAEVDNPDFSDGTPFPATHNIDLANYRTIVYAYGPDVFLIREHLECDAAGNVIIVETPEADTSVVSLSFTTGSDEKGAYTDYTLAYMTAAAQYIQHDQSVITGGVVTAKVPSLRHSAGSARFMVRARPTVRNAQWVSAEFYVRHPGSVVFPTLRTAESPATLVGKSQSRWPTPLQARS